MQNLITPKFLNLKKIVKGSQGVVYKTQINNQYYVLLKQLMLKIWTKQKVSKKNIIFNKCCARIGDFGLSIEETNTHDKLCGTEGYVSPEIYVCKNSYIYTPA